MADAWTEEAEAAEVPHDLNLEDGAGHGYSDGVVGHDDVVGHGDEVIEHEEAAPAPKKRGKGARIAVLGIGVLMLGFVGLLGAQLLSGGGPKEQPVEAAAPAPTTDVTGGDQMMAGGIGGAQAGMLGDAAASAASGFPMASASSPESVQPTAGQGAQPNPPVTAQVTAQAAAPATTPAAQKPASTAQPSSPAPTATTVQAGVAQSGPSDARLAAVEQRMDKVEGDVSKLMRKPVGKASSKPASPQGAASAPVGAEATNKPAKTSSATRHASAKTKGSKAAEPSTATAMGREEFIEPVELTNFRLQAVYPVQGDDARAWVLDGQTVRVVARGDYLGSAKVIEVRRNVVVTTNGVVR